jgi:hypothetical protein
MPANKYGLFYSLHDGALNFLINMKKIYLFLILLATTFIHVRAQSPKATVYLLREVGPDEYVPYFTYLDQVLLCKLGNGKYSVHEVEPGEHKIHTQYKGKIKVTPETELLVNFEAGKTYYISLNIKTKAFGKGSFYCEQLSEDEGKKRANEYMLDKKCL